MKFKVFQIGRQKPTRIHVFLSTRTSIFINSCWLKELELALDGCSKSLVFVTRTSSKLPEETLGRPLFLLGQDFLQSDYLNVVRSEETTHYRG